MKLLVLALNFLILFTLNGCGALGGMVGGYQAAKKNALNYKKHEYVVIRNTYKFNCDQKNKIVTSWQEKKNLRKEADAFPGLCSQTPSSGKYTGQCSLPGIISRTGLVEGDVNWGFIRYRLDLRSEKSVCLMDVYKITTGRALDAPNWLNNRCYNNDVISCEKVGEENLRDSEKFSSHFKNDTGIDIEKISNSSNIFIFYYSKEAQEKFIAKRK